MMKPPPIKIKLYGLISMTKQGYILQAVLVVALMGVLMGIWFVQPTAAELKKAYKDNPMPFLAIAIRYIPALVLISGIAQSIEAYFVLRRFAREEALQQARQASEKPPAP
jgi:hypothetical protein